MTQWNNYPVSQAYNPPQEYGVDVATPYGTPITSLVSGKVVTAGYFPWGGEVAIQTQLPSGQTVDWYVQHLDTILGGIVPGTIVQPGQSLGTSGGQTSGGNHPTSTQYSTGPHTEYGVNAPWVGGGSSMNPNVITTGIGGGPNVQQLAGAANTANNLLTGTSSGISLPSNDFWIRAGLVSVGLVLLFIAFYGLLQRGPTVIEEKQP